MITEATDCESHIDSEPFRKRFFPGVKNEQWNSWEWQLKNSIKSITQLSEYISLTDEEKMINKHLPLKITPYYLSLFWNKGVNNPIRKSVVPTNNEFLKDVNEQIDPLHEGHDSPIPGLVHRYPDRVLVLTTNCCAVNCRYCTRSRIIENEQSQHIDFGKVLDYLKEHTEVRDVLLSGGDPLTMSDSRLEMYLSKLRKIEHIEIIRIGTKVPFVLPQRITDELVDMLKKYHPLYMSIHSTHPDEITEETKKAVEKLANSGIPMGSQTVLLNGINNDIDTLKKLFHGLLKIRIKPYYLYQCDLVVGTSHFRTHIREGIEIIEKLKGHTSGYAIPNLIIDAPGGGGKVTILPDFVEKEDDEFIYIKNYEGNIYKYPK